MLLAWFSVYQLLVRPQIIPQKYKPLSLVMFTSSGMNWLLFMSAHCFSIGIFIIILGFPFSSLLSWALNSGSLFSPANFQVFSYGTSPYLDDGISGIPIPSCRFRSLRSSLCSFCKRYKLTIVIGQILDYRHSSFCTLLHFTERVFYKLKVYDNPVSNKSVFTIFPTAFPHFLSLCHILVILFFF